MIKLFDQVIRKINFEYVTRTMKIANIANTIAKEYYKYENNQNKIELCEVLLKEINSRILLVENLKQEKLQLIARNITGLTNPV